MPEQNDAGKDYSLTGPSAMGGIIAGSAFDFQTRYILCRLPGWLEDPTFYQLLHEGTGDVDIRFRLGEGERWEHIQVKDHQVTPAEFREVVKTFVGFDRAKPDVYSRFSLAAPDLSPGLKPLKSCIDRLRGAKDFFDSVPKTLDDVIETAKTKLQELELADHSDFILSKVEFDIDLHSLRSNERAREAFCGTIVRGRLDIWQRLRTAYDRVYDRLFNEVSSRRQQTFSRFEIEAILDQLSVEIVISVRTPPIATIAVHNWAREMLTPPPDIELDWSNRFDRKRKLVPESSCWDGELVPEIDRLRKELLATKGSGLLRIVGSACLSTQVAIGLSFREVEGWRIETIQQPSGDIWRSDSVPTPGYQPQVQVLDCAGGGDSIALLLSIKNDLIRDVETYLASAGVKPRGVVNILPASGAGSLSVRSDGDAVALATAARDALRTAQEKYATKMTHLFMSGPQALAVFLGQRITSMGRLQVYEYQDPGYTPSCLLTT